MINHKLKRLLISFLVVSSITLFTEVICKEEQKLDLDKLAVGYLEKGQTQNYILDLQQQLLESEYLIITAEGTFEGSEPDIYINLDNFDASNRAHIICKSFGFALCHIKKKEIARAKKLYISVQCHEQCGYEITSFIEEAVGQVNMRLNDITYGIFEDSQGNTKNKKKILTKLVQMKFDKNDLPAGETLENLLIEFELMNPIESYTTFNVYLNFDERVPTRAICQSQGLNWGSGAGMGVFVQNKKVNNLLDEGTYTMIIEAHEGAIIAIRSYGWGNVRIIRPFELVTGFLFTKSSEMKYQLRLDSSEMKQFKDKDLIIGLVPFQGDPNLYADSRPFSELKTLQDYQWVSDSLLDDRIVILSNNLKNEEFLNINVASQDYFTLFTLKAYYPIGKIPLNFDYPEAGTLHPNELVQYSLSLYGNQETEITLNLQPREGKPGLVFKKCLADDKKNCQFTKDDLNKMIFGKFDAEKVTYKFKSIPKDCAIDKLEGLNTCYYIIGVKNVELDQDIRYSLIASNGITHTILQEDEIYHEGVEFGKINYYSLNLTNTQYTNITQVSFQLSNVQGQVSMFTSFDNIRPNINDNKKFSFFHSLHLYTEEMGNLSKTIYLGIQADSTFASYNLQVKVIDDMNFSYYTLQENTPLMVTEDASKVKKIHFKFYLRKSFKEDLQVKVMLEALSGFYDMKIGLDRENINDFEAEKNEIHFSTKQVSFTKYDQPIYGIITPKMSWLNNKIQFKLQYTTTSVTHQTLSVGMVNQVRLGEEEQYFKIGLTTREGLMIQKSVVNSVREDEVLVIVSFDQSILKPQLSDIKSQGDSPVFQLTNYSPYLITLKQLQDNCQYLNEYSPENNQCFLFITMKAKKPATLMLHVDTELSAQYIFSDFPNTIVYRPKQEKKLFYPELFNKQFNLFKSASFNGDELLICAKIFNNSIHKNEWPYPVGCKQGEYDFKFSTQNDESYFYDMKDNNNICDFNQKQCGLLIYLIDTSFSFLGSIDRITLTLQQSHTVLHAGNSLIDSLPPNGARFYYIELSEIKDSRFIISATEYVDDSIQLVLYVDNNRAHSTQLGHPFITVDKAFKKELKDKFNMNDNSSYGLEVKSTATGKEVSYSIMLTQSQLDDVTLKNISLGKPLQIQLADDSEYQYFIFRNKQQGQSFKIIQTQQSQGYTLITLNRVNSTNSLDLPLKQYFYQTYDNVIKVDEEKNMCENACIYIIQLQTTEAKGSFLTLTVQRTEIQLLENIQSHNELANDQSVVYQFNALKQSKLTINLQSGGILVEINKNNGEKIVSQKIKEVKQLQFQLDSLANINDLYYVNLKSIMENTKFVVSYVTEDTVPQISFDQPLKVDNIKAETSNIYTFQTSGNVILNIQLQFKFEKYVNADKDGDKVINETFESNGIPIKRTLISSTYDDNSELYIRHIQIEVRSEMKKIFMKIENLQKRGEIQQLTLYISENFTILDEGMSMFYYFNGLNELSNYYGIILPEKDRKIYIEITCLLGEIRAEGSYSRDSALKNRFQYNFQPGNRQTLDIDITSSNFYIKITGHEKHTQGYIKFTTFPAKTALPFGLMVKPEISLPILKGIVSEENNTEYSGLHFSFEPLVCSKTYINKKNNMDQFELESISYTLMIIHDKQLAYATNFQFSQIPGDLTSIEQKIKVYNDPQNREGNYTALFFSFEETSQCLKQCQSSECKQKELTIPIDNETFNTYVSGRNPTVLVRANILWKHTSSKKEITEHLYYPELQYQKDVVLPPIQQIEESSRISVFWLLLIIASCIALAVLLVFYFRKYKQTEKRLNFELTDVRNVASLASSNIISVDNHLKHIPLDEEIQE